MQKETQEESEWQRADIKKQPQVPCRLAGHAGGRARWLPQLANACGRRSTFRFNPGRCSTLYPALGNGREARFRLPTGLHPPVASSAIAKLACFLLSIFVSFPSFIRGLAVLLIPSWSRLVDISPTVSLGPSRLHRHCFCEAASNAHGDRRTLPCFATRSKYRLSMPGMSSPSSSGASRSYVLEA